MNSALVTRELWAEVASSTRSWTQALAGSGGAAKGEKCFGYLVDYEWLPDGSFQYATVDDIAIEIVLPSGETEGIALLPASEAKVTLGIATAPNGDDSHHLSAQQRTNGSR